jgi:hypothetical protein
MTHTKPLLALLLASPLAAADPAPTPTDTKLAQLVGRWEGGSTFTFRGQASTRKVSASCERAAVSPAILCSVVGVSGQNRLEEVWMFGYDRASDTYHLFMTNDWGEAYDHAAKWTDAGKAVFVYTSTRDGKPVREDYAFAFKSDELSLHGTMSLDGKLFAEGNTTLERVR